MTTNTIQPADEVAKRGKTIFPGASDAYQNARQALLADEIAFRRQMTRLVEKRRALPPGPIIERRSDPRIASGQN